MSNEESASVDASKRDGVLPRLEFATVELLGIGVVTITAGAIVFLGVIPGLSGVERGLGAMLVGVGVGIAIYSVEVVQQSASLQSIALGTAFLTTALVLYHGVWAGILIVWGVALVAIGLGAYGFVSLSRRGSRG